MGRWLVVGAWLAVGCAPAEDPVVADLESLRELHTHHKEIVQASFDMGEIGGFEQEYAIDWEGQADRVAASLEGCEPADATEMGPSDWLANLATAVDTHVGEYEVHTSFMDCWASEDDHHHDVTEGLDAAEAAAADCR